jgi:AraC family transcriptional regulator, transcriptional activator of pobA
MIGQSSFTLVNPLNGNLAFKVAYFEGNSSFDHIQRLNYYSLILIKEGTAALKADFSEYEVGKNYLLSFSPYQPYMLSQAKNLKGITIHFHPDFFCIHKHHKEVACHGVLFNNIYQPPFTILPKDDGDRFDSIIEQIKIEMKNPELAQYELLVSYLKIILISASRQKVSQSEIAQVAVADSKEPFILQNLKDAIEEHYRTKHSANDYAEILNITPKALAKVAKNYFNKTLTNLISDRIIIEAKRELYLTSKTVKEISYHLGFNDEHYFSRFFKNNAEVSPQLYRETVGFARGEA